jgi:hypothetical protein
VSVREDRFRATVKPKPQHGFRQVEVPAAPDPMEVYVKRAQQAGEDAYQVHKQREAEKLAKEQAEIQARLDKVSAEKARLARLQAAEELRQRRAQFFLNEDMRIAIYDQYGLTPAERAIADARLGKNPHDFGRAEIIALEIVAGRDWKPTP